MGFIKKLLYAVPFTNVSSQVAKIIDCVKVKFYFKYAVGNLRTMNLVHCQYHEINPIN